jgi:hypothetical protein
MSPVRERYGEAFWRVHHEAWVESELNQREYCEAYGIPLKAFGNWRAKFKAEPQLPARKMLHRRRGLSHALSHGLSHGLSHDLRPTIPPAREGRRRYPRLWNIALNSTAAERSPWPVIPSWLTVGR